MIHFNSEKVTNYIEGLQGYKLSETHFRIGSSYHTDTFIHAKVLLHNSFYTSRIALSIADSLSSQLEGKTSITLVGYERYSELLIGLLTHFLHTKYKVMSISSCIMVDDGTKVEVLGNPTCNPDYVVIVPIVSTGGTTKRIISQYKHYLTSKNDPIHVYHIIHLRPDNQTQIDIDNCTTLISQHIDWSEPHNCIECFDPDPSKRKVLLEADQSNLNPIVIFGMPSIKKVAKIATVKKGIGERISFVGCDFKDVNFEHSLIYMKERGNDGLGIRTYSQNIDDFVRNNKRLINNWLDSVKAELGVHASDRIVILSPCQNNMTNMSFVNLVNERLFGSSATVLYHEVDREYPENFRLLNYSFLHNRSKEDESENNLKVFYVDDGLVTGHTFFSIYDLFRFSTKYDKRINLTGAIFLMNKASASVNERVTRAANQIHSFVAINMPQYYSVGQSGPFSREIQRYDSITKRCLSYTQEKFFKEKRDQLKNKGADLSSDEKKDQLHLQMFYATNALFELFSKHSKEKIEKLTFSQLFESCRGLDYRIDNPFAIIRVLSRETFTMYWSLKSSVFNWNSSFLSEQVEGIKEWMRSNNTESISEPTEKQLSLFHRKGINVVKSNHQLLEEDLEDLITLIRRSVLVGNYQIIQPQFFLFLSEVIQYIEHKPWNSNQFIEGLLNLYCELINKNTACAPKILNSLKEADSGLDSDYRTNGWRLFKDRLWDETVIVLDDLYRFMAAIGFHEAVHLGQDISIEYEVSKNVVLNWLNKTELKSRVAIAESIMNVKSSGLSFFINYLRLKHFFELDKNDDSRSGGLKARMDEMFTLIKRFSNNGNDIGAFFVVVDIKGILRLVYDRNKNGAAILRNRFRREGFQQFLKNLDPNLDGAVIKIIDSDNCSVGESEFLERFGESYNHLALIQIGSVEEGESATYGYIGLYSDINFMDSVIRQYMLLLRRDLMNYISLHHKNEEFVELLLAENKKRFAYLSGHGREMMQKLAKHYPNVFEDAVTTMERVQGIFMVDDSNKEIGCNDFDYYFPPDSLTKASINQLLDKVEKMATQIYNSPIVEWDEEATITLSKLTDDFEGGSFNLYLLEYICFELIVNAKKNRFFKTKSFSDVYNGGFTPFANNDLSIGITSDDSWKSFRITVTGTGPRVWDTTLKRINANEQIKENDDISGLDLIIQLIKVFDNNNKVIISTNQFAGPVYKNTVTVQINCHHHVDRE